MASPTDYIRAQRKPSISRTVSALMRILSKASPDDLADLETVETWAGDTFYGNDPRGSHAVGSARVLGIGPGSEASGAGAVEMSDRYASPRDGDGNDRATMKLDEMLSAVREAGYSVEKSRPADTLAAAINGLVKKGKAALRAAALEDDDNKRGALMADACAAVTKAKELLKAEEDEEEGEAERDDEEVEKAVTAIARLESRIKKSVGGMQSLDIKGYLTAVSGAGIATPPNFNTVAKAEAYAQDEDDLTISQSIARAIARNRLRMAMQGSYDASKPMVKAELSHAQAVLEGRAAPGSKPPPYSV